MMNYTDEIGAASNLKRGKRKITEARKEQNRTAQQVYRRRQKERLSLVNRSKKILLRTYHDLKPRQSSDIRSYPGDCLYLDVAEFGPGEQIQSPSDLELPPNRISNQPENFDISFDHESYMPELSTSSNVNYELLSSHLVPATSLSHPDLSRLPASHIHGDLPLQNLDPVYELTKHDEWENPQLASHSTSLDWDNVEPASITPESGSSMDSMLMTCYYPQQKLRERLCNTLEDSQKSLESSIDEDLDQLPEVDALVSAVSNFVNTRQFQPTVRHVPLPDPRSNHLYCIQTATLLPYLHNARCIGLNIQDLIAMKSPFYRPNTTMAADPTSLLLEARKPWIPAHLQPTLAQILFPHHPYLDLLPFPALRERAITYAAMFEAMDLKLDVFREGLACSPRSTSGGGAGCGQPWDRRSWEVKPWFWRKWRLLVDSSGMGAWNGIDGVDGSGTAISVL